MTDDEMPRKRPPRSLRYQEDEDSEPEQQTEQQYESQTEATEQTTYTETIENQNDNVIEQSTDKGTVSDSAIRKSPILSSRIVYPAKTHDEKSSKIYEEQPSELQPQPKKEPPKQKTSAKPKQTAKLSKDEANEDGELNEQLKEMKEVASETKEALQKIVDNYIKKLSDKLEAYFARVKAALAALLLRILKILTIGLNTILIPIFRFLFKIVDGIFRGIVFSIKNFREGMKTGAKKVSKGQAGGKPIPATQNVSSSPSATPSSTGQNGLYANLVTQNINFLTFRKQPIVREDIEDKETVFIENALADIKYCKRFVDKLPSPTEGPYAGRSIVEIFENVQEEDISKFLTYVQKYPEIFKEKDFKISEAFATWVIKKSKESV